jgi:hypothetical protein
VRVILVQIDEKLRRNVSSNALVNGQHTTT